MEMLLESLMVGLGLFIIAFICFIPLIIRERQKQNEHKR